MSQKPYEALRSVTGKDWPSISASREKSRETLRAIQEMEFLPETDAEEVDLNVQIVVFGSLARGEMTSGSDIDWTLLIDGPANPEHLRLARNVEKLLVERRFKKPSGGGPFGSLCSSHEMIHLVGGARDLNENLTRRMLLLLEAFTIPNPSNRVVLSRVIRQVLRRYIDCDPSVSRLSSNRPVVPRFLLNDLVRYWRTMAVDYAAKKWEQEGKWALRNTKLRMSRKLIFVKGLLMCLKCELLEYQSNAKATDASVIAHCENTAALSAIDVLCKHLMECEGWRLLEKLLDCYDQFLLIIDDEGNRKHLENLRFEDAGQDDIFQQVRGISRDFQESLTSLFFEEAYGLRDLTMEYGVF